MKTAIPTWEQVMISSPLTVTPDTRVLDAIAAIDRGLTLSEEEDSPSQSHSDCVLIVEDRQLLGIFTQRDVVHLVASGTRLSRKKIARVMTQPVISLTLGETQSVPMALSIMRQHQIRHLPVVDEAGNVVGLVTQDRLYQAIEPSQMLALGQVDRSGEKEVEESQHRDTALKQHQLSILRDISDRKAAQAQLRDREAFLGSIYEGTAQAVFVIEVTANGEFLYLGFNRVAQQYAGLTHGQIYRKTPEEAFGSAIGAAFRQRYDRCLQAGTSISYEEQIVFEDRRIWTLTTLSPIWNPEGRMDRIVGTATDITDHKQAEADLKQSERKFRAIFDGTFQFIGLLTTEGIVVEANRTALDAIDADLADVIGQPFWATPWWTHSPQLQQQLQQATVRAAQGEFVRFEAEHLLADGTPVFVDFSLKPFFDEAGKVVMLIPEGRDITDRKQSERALLELSTALEHAVEGISRLDTQGHYLSVNKAYANAVGYSPMEMIQMAWPVTVHPEDLAKLEAAYQQMLEDGKVEVEARGVRKDGSVFDKQLVMITAYDEQENFTGHYCFMKDISARKAAEAALHQSEERYRTLFNSIDEGFCLIDLIFDANGKPVDYRFLETNPAFEKLTGLQNVVGKTIREISPTIESYWYETFGEVALTGEPVRFTNEAKGIPEPGWFEVYAFRVNGQENRNVALLFNNITDRKLAERKIREQAALIDIATDAISVRDLDNRTIFWSPGAERLYGWTAAEALGEKIEELIYPECHLAEFEIATHDTLEKGSWQGELEKVTKTGKTLIVASRWTLVRDESEQPKFILVVSTDITEKKQLEQQFYRTQRLDSLGTLAGGIAHDLNNIFAPILMISQLLPLKLLDLDERTQKLLKNLEISAKRGAALVKQILIFTRGTEGKLTVLQVGHLLNEVEKMARQTFPKSIEIRTDISSITLWQVKADPTQLHQVFMNLAVNARDAMPNGGLIEISAENRSIDETAAAMHLEARAGNYIVITVDDTGMGMSPEILDRIFEPFFTTKEIGKGTGLGLSTVRGIVKNHGGFVRVLSQVGKGTQFQVYLPAVEETAIESTQQPESFRGNGELILIVDDEAAVRQITAAALDENHYKIVLAHDGMEAIAIYRRHQNKIRIVLLDMMMPNMDGVTAIRSLCALNPRVKIIATSGLPNQRQLAIAAGAKEFIEKPYNIQELLQTLAEVLETH